MYSKHILENLKKNNFSEISHVFQPQLELISNKIIGVEILTRWFHNNIFISPIEFIKIAESENFIYKIDFFTFDRALNFIDKNKIKTSINFSIKTLEIENFEKKIFSILKNYPSINKHLIVIEITETVKVTNLELIQKNLNFLKNLNIQIFLDDFSIEFSNLFALSSYPISGVKIDKSILELIYTTNGRKILTAFFIFLKTLELDIIFEGVEKLIELNFLMKCQIKNIFIQGFYISKPLNQKDLINFLNIY